MKDKEEKVDICCFRYKCKRCPKARKCEEERKRDDTIERRKFDTDERTKQE